MVFCGSCRRVHRLRHSGIYRGSRAHPDYGAGTRQAAGNSQAARYGRGGGASARHVADAVRVADAVTGGSATRIAGGVPVARHIATGITGRDAAVGARRTAPGRASPRTAQLGRTASQIRHTDTERGARVLYGGNALVRAGVVVLFFGVAFLLRYVAEHTRIPIEFRLAGVAAGAIGLLALGWWLRKSRPGYALALQGGAVGILYLVIFAALHLYAVMPASAAFALLAALAALSATLAVLQNSMAFALLAVTGGFLAPILSSTGQGNHIVLFSYYAVLNAAIVAIAWFKAWRPLNLAGFVFTFVIGTAWGVLRYRAEDFSTTEPFLVLFFLIYVAVAVLFTLRQAANLRGYVDGTLVFGCPSSPSDCSPRCCMISGWAWRIARSR